MFFELSECPWQRLGWMLGQGLCRLTKRSKAEIRWDFGPACVRSNQCNIVLHIDQVFI